jgi:hypothetical protein
MENNAQELRAHDSKIKRSCIGGYYHYHEQLQKTDSELGEEIIGDNDLYL